MAGGLEVDRYVIGIRVAGEVQVDRGAQRRPAGGWSGRERREEVGESDASPPGDRAPSLDAHQPRDLLVVREAPEQIADRQVLEATRGEARDPQRPGGQVLGARGPRPERRGPAAARARWALRRGRSAAFHPRPCSSPLTRADQPTTIERNVSQPSATTRTTCGTMNDASTSMQAK